MKRGLVTSVKDNERQLKKINFYRAAIPSTYKGFLIAVTNTLVSKEQRIQLPECWVACSLFSGQFGYCSVYSLEPTR